MAKIDDIIAAQQAEKADLVALAGLVPQLLTAIANQSMTAAQAQQVLDEINSEDASLKTLISSTTSALPTPSN